MPRILLVCEFPTLLGGERSMLATLDGVRAAGYTLAVAAPPQGPLAEALRGRGIEVLPFAPCPEGQPRPPQGQIRAELAGLIRSWRPDLLHANSLAMGRLAGPVVAGLGVPSVAHLRDIIKLSRQAAADLGCNGRLLAVSGAVRDFHAAAGRPAEKIHVLYNGVDLERFRPRPPSGDLHRQLGLAPGVPLLGTIGQLALRKGQDVLLAAMTRVAGEFPDVHCLVVGARWSDKDESRRFEADLRAAAERLGGRVHWLGVRDDVDRLLPELTVLVHPARQEPLGRVLLEAAACGVAVVATDVGGTREIFPASSDSARLVPPDDAVAMAAAIGQLLGDPALRVRLGIAARRRAEAAFDIRTAAAGLVRHYQEVVGQ